MQIVIAWLLFTLPACVILNNKHRGAGYYVLAFLMPLVGLIFALCLKKLDQEEPVSLDITDDTNQN